jgi:hypothetical protein
MSYRRICDNPWLVFLFHPMLETNGCVVVWPIMKDSSTLVEMGGRESRQVYLMGTPSLVKTCSPNVISSTICDSPNVLMGEQESR